MKNTGQELIRLARTKVLIETPYMAPALTQMPLIISENVPTAAVSDRGVIYFNPKFAESIAEASADTREAAARIGFVLYHEVMHFVRDHAGRRPDHHISSQERWNIAADCEINDHVPLGLQFPQTAIGEPLGILPSQFQLPDGELAEWYYQHLPNNAGELFVDILITGGSAADGVRREWEKDEDGGLNTAEITLIREGVARGVIDHAKSTGNVPASLVRWAEWEIERRVDWRQRLRRVIGKRIGDAQLARCDYSFRRPNRRYQTTTNVILPQLRQTTTPNIVVVVDTSGSVGETELKCAVGEVLNLAQTFQTEVVVIPCDAQAYEATKVRTKRDFRTETLKGGGGTDMKAGIQAAEQYQPDAIIVITDGYTPYPETNDSRVVWCVYHTDESLPPTPPSPPWRSEQIIRVRLTS